MNFLPLQQIHEWCLSESEKEFAGYEFAHDFSYYLQRVDRLMFAGNDVLDAGCGMGQWSIALAQRFRNVAAIDLKPERLEVLKNLSSKMGLHNIRCQVGALEALDFQDASFDAVFCYGVIMFTPISEVLKEFYRILRPGGRVYLCLNGDGWSHYLAHERGRDNPSLRNMGLETLYQTAWHRAVNSGLQIQLQNAAKSWSVRFLSTCLGRMHRHGLPTRALTKVLLGAYETGRMLFRTVEQECGTEFMKRLSRDVAFCLGGSDILKTLGNSRAYLPSELENLIKQGGFTDFQWACENHLICDPAIPTPAPRYSGDYKGRTCVWECLFGKRDAECVGVSLERHFEAARIAQRTSVYLESSKNDILSNARNDSYPSSLLEWAQRQALLGGGDYLKRVADLVVQGADDEHDAACRILRFVQRALFRDPISQPLLSNKGLPDAATILFCARGRCGHSAALCIALCESVGIAARLRQLPRHVIAEMKVRDRWVIADADAFKNGVLPTNDHGQLLSMEELEDNPYRLDRFPATGWLLLPGTRYARGINGYPVGGYVDALEPIDRGFVSGYYVPSAKGQPPSLPSNVRLRVNRCDFELEWSSSHVRGDTLLGYRVCVSTNSRGWSYDDLGDRDQVVGVLPADVLSVQTTETKVRCAIPSHATQLFASVTAISSRIEREPKTYFYPSGEVAHDL